MDESFIEKRQRQFLLASDDLPEDLQWRQSKLTGGEDVGYLGVNPGVRAIVVGSDRVADLSSLYCLCMGVKDIYVIMDSDLETQDTKRTLYHREGSRAESLDDFLHEIDSELDEVIDFRAGDKKEEHLVDSIKNCVTDNTYLLLSNLGKETLENLKKELGQPDGLVSIIEAETSPLGASVYCNIDDSSPSKSISSGVDEELENALTVGSDGIASALSVNYLLREAMFGERMSQMSIYNPLMTQKIVHEREGKGAKLLRIKAVQTAAKRLGSISFKRIGMVGAGAMGNWEATFLSLMGFKIDVYDHDVTEVHNFARQPWYKGARGEPKASTLARNLEEYMDADVKGIDSEIVGPAVLERYMLERERAITSGGPSGGWPVKEENLGDLLTSGDKCKYSILTSCVDNFEVRKDLNDFAVDNNLPLFEGGIGLYDLNIISYVPGQTKCIDCHLHFDYILGPRLDKIKKDIAEGKPGCSALPTGSHIMPNLVVSALKSDEILKYLLGFGRPLDMKYEVDLRGDELGKLVPHKEDIFREDHEC